MNFVHSVYRLLLPEALRRYLHQYLRQYELRMQQAKKERQLQRYKKHLGSAARRKRQLKELRTILRKRPLKVAFQVAQAGKWKNESVLRLMMQDPQIEPMVWVVPVGGEVKATSATLHAREAALIHQRFDGHGIPVVEYPDIAAFPAEERPDLIFIHEAYDYIFRKESYQGLTEERLCYVPYCFHNTNEDISINGVGCNCAVYAFYENETVAGYTAARANKGRNSIASGNPIADLFLNDDAKQERVWKDCGSHMKKVIWAPHWTITPDACWIVCGTFLKNAEAMLELAQKYEHRIQFAFKPHPHLYRILCKHPDWGKEKTDAFYRRWAELPNTQLDEGAYTALIMQSDAIVHDSGSFILEYLFADKPGMFLREGEGYGNYNSMTLDALRCYHKGLTKADIEDFLQQCVLGSADPLAPVRAEMRCKYLLPPHGKTAAQNILDTIKNS